MLNLRTPSPIALAAALLIGCAAQEPAPTVAAGPESQTQLNLKVAPFPSFYFQVRNRAAGLAPVEPMLQSTVDAYLPVQNEVGAWGGFWRFDLPGMLSSSPAQFGQWFAEMPESIPGRRGGVVPLKAPGEAMASAMADAFPAYVADAWPRQRARLEAAVAALEQDFMPRHREALSYMLKSLGIADPSVSVDAYLVPAAHPPGASTYRAKGSAVMVLSVDELLAEGRPSDLEETLLHEACHALDVASRGEEDAFTRLRNILAERGVTGSPLRDVPHMIMFVQSEETMRRLFNPGHVAYGDTWRGDIAPLYERSGKRATVVRREWRSYLDGAQTMTAALQAIADELAPLQVPGKTQG